MPKKRESEMKARTVRMVREQLERVSQWWACSAVMIAGMVRQGLITDEFWSIVEPLLPTSRGRVGRPWADHRLILEGVCWRYRTGSPWRDVPVEFGPWQTVWKRHFRWSTDGTYERIFTAAQDKDAGLLATDGEPIEVQVQRMLSVDSTVVRAHQHAAGARRDSVSIHVGEAAPGHTGGAHRMTRICRSNRLIMPWAGPGAGSRPRSIP